MHYNTAKDIRVVRFSNEQVFSGYEGIVAEIIRICCEMSGDTDPTPNPSPTREGSTAGMSLVS